MSIAIMLGKRKQREELEKQDDSESEGCSHSDGEASELDQEAIQEVFRRHFEAQFAPLDVQAIHKAEAHQQAKDVEEEEEETDWEGISEDEPGVVQVVEHRTVRGGEDDGLSRREIKAFMSAKPPSSAAKGPAARKKQAVESEADEADNLKNDLALQRLLKESHLLDSSAATLATTGANRHKSTDLRVQGLGAKMSILKQEKMPLSHRRGITTKATEKEHQRRKEARENGIILERVTKTKGSSARRREKTVGAPTVGKFRGGTLSLNKRDVASIEGPKGHFAKRKKGRR